VQEKLRAIQTEVSAGTLADAGRLTVADAVRRWLDNTAKSNVRATTWARYDQLARIHVIPAFGQLALGKLRHIHVESFYAEMERAGASAWVRRAAGILLTSVLRNAVRMKLIPYSPAEGVVKARPVEKETQHLTESQCKKLLGALLGYRLHPLFVLAIGSGMRQGELLGLQWGDFDFDRGTLTVARSLAQIGGKFVVKEPKTRTSKRTITLPEFVLATLKDHRQAMLAEGNIANPVFCTKSGQFIGKSNLIRQVHKPAVKRTNDVEKKDADKGNRQPDLLPAGLRFHDLRHTHATSLLSKGFSLKAVSQRLGHANVELTLRVYCHVLPSDDATLAKGLDRMFG
jgi:integrase